jgi:quinol monooxygenase YgiN
LEDTTGSTKEEFMAGFVQIIQYKTSNFDEMQKLSDKFREQTEGRRTVARVMVCRDRDNAGQFMTIAEFPSYEAAMKNNDLPETQEFAGEMMKLADGPPTFYNLDLERVEDL